MEIPNLLVQFNDSINLARHFINFTEISTELNIFFGFAEGGRKTHKICSTFLRSYLSNYMNDLAEHVIFQGCLGRAC